MVLVFSTVAKIFLGVSSRLTEISQSHFFQIKDSSYLMDVITLCSFCETWKIKAPTYFKK